MPTESAIGFEQRRSTKPGEEELYQRLLSSVEHMLELVGPSAVSEALSAPTGFDSMSRLLDSLLQEHPEVVLVDRELASHLRLRQAHRDLLERAGGTYDTAEVSEILGITPEGVRKRLQRGALLAYKSPSGEYRLPRAQFSETGTLPGLEDVLDAMHVDDPWMRIQLFLDEDVFSALQDERIEDAVRAVESYLPRDEHGG